jgi:hypothetical protein
MVLSSSTASGPPSPLEKAKQPDKSQFILINIVKKPFFEI